MSASPTLTDLAAMVEKLTGPCRETDARIQCALDGHLFVSFSDDRGMDQISTINGGEKPLGIVLAYTASLDAAMTLVPDDVWYCLSGPHSAAGGLYLGGERRFDMTVGIGEDRSDGRAATAPNAIIAAALRFRARAASESSHG